MDKLKPCPFCGSKLELLGLVYTHPKNKCFLAIADTEYEAVWFYAEDNDCIAKWNSRAKMDGERIVVK